MGSNGPRDKLTQKVQKKECESCLEMIYVAQFHLHFKSCKIYFMHMRKLPSGFECRLCSHQTTHNEGLALKPRIRMYNHLNNIHSEKYDLSNRDELQEDQKPERNNKNDQLKGKGQLILKCPFGVFKSPKKLTIFFPGFLP